jgi:hypothetical protein
MKKLMIAAVALIVALLVPGIARAHEGHVHHAMGTISSMQGNSIMVKTTDGKTVMVMLDAKTKITQGKQPVDAKALTVGDRVVAEGPEHNEMIMATTVRLGATPTAAKK